MGEEFRLTFIHLIVMLTLAEGAANLKELL